MNRDRYAYCSDIPEGFSEALEMMRNEEKYGPRQVFLNPIPAAIAGISAAEWIGAIDRCEELLLGGGA